MIIFPGRKALVRALYDKKRFEYMLYVGCALKRPTDYQKIRKMAKHITCVEVWKPVAESIRERGLWNEVICADIYDWIPEKPYDIAIWWHGPEHMDMDKAQEVILRLRDTMPIVWLATPHGLSPQGGIRNNPYEEHRSVWYANDFEALGFRTGVSGHINTKGSQLVAWHPKDQVNEARPF